MSNTLMGILVIICPVLAFIMFMILGTVIRDDEKNIKELQSSTELLQDRVNKQYMDINRHEEWLRGTPKPEDNDKNHFNVPTVHCTKLEHFIPRVEIIKSAHCGIFYKPVVTDSKEKHIWKDSSMYRKEKDAWNKAEFDIGFIESSIPLGELKRYDFQS